MGTIKTITHLEESKKLAGFLKGSDYTWFKDKKLGYVASQCPYDLLEDDDKEENYPCWTLPALLDLIPEVGLFAPSISKYWECHSNNIVGNGETPIDACVDLIIKLHKEDML